MFNSKYLAENISKFRKNKKLSQANLADMLNVSPQSVSKWECGVSVPDVENLCLLSEILGVTIDALLEHCAEQKKVMIGVDGGGTKTQFMLFTEDGNILDNIKLDACNPNTVGIQASIDVLTRGITTLMATNPNISGIFIGSAGFLLGNNSVQIMSALKKSFPHIKMDCASDMLNIAASALEDDSCCIAGICGTGSSILIKQYDKLTRLSGYGYLLSKSGSGYDIGRDALYAAMCDIDGYGESTALTPLIQAKLGKSISDIIDKVCKNNAAFTASLAQIVFECYRKGDNISTKIITENAKALAEVINVAHEKNPNITNAVISGGIITQNTDFAQLVRDYLTPGVNLIIPTCDPILGACMLCARMCNINTAGLLKKLQEHYR